MQKITPIILRHLYIKKRLSQIKIGKLFNLTPSAIQKRMVRYSIPARKLKEATIKISIPKEELQKLYWKQKLSTAEIAKRYNCTHSAIIYKMHSFGIKRRTKLGLRKPVKISEKTLRNLYENKKLSETKVAKLLDCSRHAVEVRMKLYGIKPRYYSESNTRYPKKNFNNNPIEKSYLIGFRLGDLNVFKKDHLIVARCSTTRPAQVNLIKELFSPYTFVYTKPSRILKGRQVIDIRCQLNKSFAFLLPKKDNIERWIQEKDKTFFAFTAGYIDAEGYIYTRLQKKAKTPSSGIEIQSYDKNILHQIWKGLKKRRVECPRPLLNKMAGYISKGIRNNKDLWRLTITKKNSLALLFDKISPYIKHQDKLNSLNIARQNVISRL